MSPGRRDVIGALAALGLAQAAGAGTGPGRGIMVEVEFHFTEGFTGQPVRIQAPGAEAAFTAKTRLMLGLAHIAPLVLADGEEVTLTVDDTPGGTVTVTVEAERPFVVISRSGDGLTVTSRAQRPGYV